MPTLFPAAWNANRMDEANFSELQALASKFRLRITHDECGEAVIRGRAGHMYLHSSGLLGLVVEASAMDRTRDCALQRRRGRALRGGFQPHLWGDVEAILLFEADDDQKCALAIRLAGIRVKRRSSFSQLKNLRRGPGTSPSAPVPSAGARSGGAEHA